MILLCLIFTLYSLDDLIYGLSREVIQRTSCFLLLAQYLDFILYVLDLLKMVTNPVSIVTICELKFCNFFKFSTCCRWYRLSICFSLVCCFQHLLGCFMYNLKQVVSFLLPFFFSTGPCICHLGFATVYTSLWIWSFMCHGVRF